MEDKIQCPQCGYNFDVEEVLRAKIETKLAKQNDEKIEKAVQEIRALDKKNFDMEFEKKLKNELQILQNEKKDVLTQLELAQEQSQQAQRENIELKKKEFELLRKEKEIKQYQEELRIKLETELLQKENEIIKKAKENANSETFLEIEKLKKQLSDAVKASEELKRKAEQGSVQLQGEVQEIAVQEILQKAYPIDKIEEVKKGARGADWLQIVTNALQQPCGTIVYECKNAKNFDLAWIEKLKNDQLNHKADIAVLVTNVMPKDMLGFGEKNGVWICGLPELQSLSLALRTILLKTQSVRIAQENQSEKSAILYKYFIGSEFKQTIKSIVETYTTMKTQLDKEKIAMTKLWAEREKHLEKITVGTVSIFGSISGIAGDELIGGNFLELGEISSAPQNNDVSTTEKPSDK